MPFYATPGVYVEEVPSGARPIGAVGTSTAAFVGVAPDRRARLGDATAVNSWTEFVKHYVGDAEETTDLANAVYGFFENGGGRCYVVNIEEGQPVAGTARQRTGLRALEAIDEVAIVAAPGYADPDSWDALLTHCEKLEDRVAILDPPAEIEDVEQLTRVATAPAAPAAASTGSASGRRGSSAAEGEDEADRTAGGGGADADPNDEPGLRPRNSAYGAFYFPRIYARNPITGTRVTMAPSGHMAGTWALTDTSRGVHKAPANMVVRGALDLSYAVTREEQAILNPAGVNCIRYFPGGGILVWGARTLDEEASPFRYLNVRRLFNQIKESVQEGTQWIVFEPNTYSTWLSITRDLKAFLTLVWRDGALLGRTPQEAFFVKCDDETNPPEERDAGRIVCHIGIAPVKPAEFVVFKLSQSTGGAEIETIGA
jgi:hypothetical protein